MSSGGGFAGAPARPALLFHSSRPLFPGILQALEVV